MEEQYITFETAKLAKEKGFNIRQSAYYDEHANLCEVYSCYCNDRDVNECSCGAWESYDEGEKAIQTPTQALLQKWLREVHKVDVQLLRNKPGYDEYRVEIYKTNESSNYQFISVKENGGYVLWRSKYEEALEIGLLEGLKLI
jgi:hypothetical protein